MKLPARFSRSARKVFFLLHLWTGLIIGLWFAMMGLTGSVIAWLPELIPLEMKARFPHERATPDAPQIPLSQAISAMKTAHPNTKPAEMAVVLTPNERFPFYFFFRDKPVEGSMYLVDPYSGKVHPPMRVEDFAIGWVAHFHANLLLDAKGLIANGIGAFFGVLLLLSGLWLWWPSTVKQLKMRLRVKREASLVRRLYDWHNVAGIYLYGVLLLVTVTAVLMALNGSTDGSLEKAIDRRAGVLEEKPPTVTPRGARLPDDELVRLAKAAIPDRGKELQSVMRPQKPNEVFTANYGTSGEGLLAGGHIEIDPYSGKVLHIERDATSSPGHKFIGLTHDLHYGTWGGVWTKLLYTFAGLMPLALFITGVRRWWLRRKNRNSRIKGDSKPIFESTFAESRFAEEDAKSEDEHDVENVEYDAEREETRPREVALR